MKYIPKRHQEIALDFLESHDRCALFLDMGLGKTVVTLTRIADLIFRHHVHKALVIAPKRVAEDTWTREVAKWDHTKHLRVSTILGNAKDRLAALREDADLYVINRENVAWLVEQIGLAWPFEMVVIDELSSFKSTKAKRWRELKKVIRLSEYVVALTGTPASNGYMDLWPEIYLIDSGEALGRTLTAYRDKYFTPGARNGNVIYEWHLKNSAKGRIDSKLRPFCLSMSKEDWIDLPPIIYNDIPVRMESNERAIYDRLQREKIIPLYEQSITELEDSESAVVGSTAATLSMKLLQMANGAVYDDKGSVFYIHDRKLDALEELVDSSGETLMVFYSYKHDALRIQERFPQARFLTDSVSISNWNLKKIPMLLCHPASAGHGLNLQEGGHTIVWFGIPWSLELYQQANARLYRQGQERSVIVHHILCEDTLDRRVLSVLQGKDHTQKALLNALKGYMRYETI